MELRRNKQYNFAMGEGVYKQKVFCSNCNFRGEIEIARGVLVDKAECPNCGNKTLDRDDPIVTTNYYNFE